MSRPLTPSAAPASRAVSAFGRRMSRTMRPQASSLVALPVRARSTSPGGMVTEPSMRLSRKRASTTLSRPPSISRRRPRCCCRGSLRCAADNVVAMESQRCGADHESPPVEHELVLRQQFRIEELHQVAQQQMRPRQPGLPVIVAAKLVYARVGVIDGARAVGGEFGIAFIFGQQRSQRAHLKAVENPDGRINAGGEDCLEIEGLVDRAGHCVHQHVVHSRRPAATGRPSFAGPG